MTTTGSSSIVLSILHGLHHWFLHITIHIAQCIESTWHIFQLRHSQILRSHHLLHGVWIAHHLQRLTQQLRIVHDFPKLRIGIHELSHLWIHLHHVPHHVGIVKERLHHGRIHHLRDLFRVHILRIHHTRRHATTTALTHTSHHTRRHGKGVRRYSWRHTWRWGSCSNYNRSYHCRSYHCRSYRRSTLDEMKRRFLHNCVITERSIILQDPALINQSLQRRRTILYFCHGFLHMSDSSVRQGAIDIDKELGAVGKTNEESQCHDLM